MGGVGKVFGVGGSLSVGRCGPDDMMGGGDILPVDVAAQPTTTPEGARTTSTFGERWASARTRIQPQLPCHLPGQLVRLPDPLIPPRTLPTVQITATHYTNRFYPSTHCSVTHPYNALPPTHTMHCPPPRLVSKQNADNSSFRLFGQHDTSPDAARAQTEDGRKKFWRSPIFR